MNWNELASKFAQGFRKSDISQKGMHVTDSEAVRLRKMMKEEGYAGALGFFICKKVHEESEQKGQKYTILANMLREINCINMSDKELKTQLAKVKNEVGSIDSAINELENEDVRFCTLIYKMQSGDKDIWSALHLCVENY